MENKQQAPTRRRLQVIDGIAEAPSNPGPRYFVRGGQIWVAIPKRGEVAEQVLTNFVATIVGQELLDDGVNQATTYIIEGRLANGRALATLRVKASEFATLRWVVQWGAEAVVFAGRTSREHLRAAIQILSTAIPTTTVYQHTGWCVLDDEWAYLTANGAVTADGFRNDVQIQLPAAQLSNYRLPPPLTGDAARASVRDFIDLIAIGDERITYPLLAVTIGAVTSIEAPLNYVTIMLGKSGSFKTSTGAVFQAAFGAGFNAQELPANWSGTGNSLEYLGHHIAHATMLVDDFAPQASEGSAERQERSAQQFIRGSANRAGRSRLSSGGGMQKTYHSRAAVISTNEYLPKGESLLARCIVLPFEVGCIDPGRLRVAQAKAAEGVYASAMSAFISYIAGNMETLARYRLLHPSLRDELLQPGMHPQTASHLASMNIALWIFFDFAKEIGALPEWKDYIEKVPGILLEVAKVQLKTNKW